MSSLALDERPEAPLFSDGVGDRVVVADGATGELLQILRLRPALTAVPSFEFALRERAARLANFRHAYYARVRRVDRGTAPSQALAIVSDHVEGTRLSDILRVAHEKQLQLDINAALCLIRQLVPAVAVLHENARDVAHGLIAPERLLITPNARLLITEHVLGAAIEQLQYGRDRLWQEFRVAMPPSAGLPRFDHRTDVTGIGLVALALVLGRPLGADEYPHQIPALLNSATERSALGEQQPLSAPLRGWLARALQVDVRRAFASAPEALAALEEIVADDSMYVAAPVALETFLSRYIGSLLEPLAVPERAAPVVPPVAPSEHVEPAPVAHAAPVETHQDVAEPEPPRPSEPLDISELLGSEPLPGIGMSTLFNPDDPFTPLHAASSEPAPPSGRTRRRVVVMAAMVAVLAAGGFASFKWYGSRTPVAPAAGTLVVQSNPVGVQVFVDGVERGVTPTRLSVAPGAHILELRGRGTPRVIPLNVTAGAEVSQYLEFAESPSTGQIVVQSNPAGAKVLVDGIERGVSPLTIADLPPGTHEVVLHSDASTARHTVIVQAGGTASLMSMLSGAIGSGPSSGWVSFKAPFTIELRENGKLLGTSDTDRIMMAAGRHELELVNDSLGYRATRVVQVPSGKTAALTVDLPQGVINLNASPWAEVWIDGQRAGETPMGNFVIAIGPHEIVFKHPQLGEKRHAVSVTANAPVRLSVDMK